MNKWVIDSFYFEHPFNCIISAPTMGGKTHMLKEIIKFIDSRQAKLSNKGLARAVLLSIQQVYKLYMKWYPFLSICLLNTQK